MSAVAWSSTLAPEDMLMRVSASHTPSVLIGRCLVIVSLRTSRIHPDANARFCC